MQKTTIKGVERFAVGTDHSAYNWYVGLLFDTNITIDDLKKLLAEYQVVIVRNINHDNDQVRKTFQSFKMAT